MISIKPKLRIRRVSTLLLGKPAYHVERRFFWCLWLAQHEGHGIASIPCVFDSYDQAYHKCLRILSKHANHRARRKQPKGKIVWEST